MLYVSDNIPHGQPLLDTIHANLTRLVTKIRFIVESINGHTKTCFRYFNHVWFNRAIPHLMQDFRNDAALHNKLHYRIISDIDNSDEIAQIMLDMLNKPNLLCDLVCDQNLNRRTTSFSPLNSTNIEGFPRLSSHDLYRVSLGTQVAIFNRYRFYFV